ncbi:hypothetical protein F2Q68_00028152 [Brassica cretica]|uniref:F-box domain-containing protein n=1 Tax=Brassica cretica TaxID=69181 RepID=A0A8S9IEM4_BRACR|nr:hypothetical protein F2Q68_00028152 [Brassica cretica]
MPAVELQAIAPAFNPVIRHLLDESRVRWLTAEEMMVPFFYGDTVYLCRHGKHDFIPDRVEVAGGRVMEGTPDSKSFCHARQRDEFLVPMAPSHMNNLSSLPLELLLYIISFLPFESARLIPFVSKRFRSAWSQAIVVPHSHNGSIEETSHTLSSFINNFNEHDPSKSTRKMELHLNKSTSVSTILGPHNTMHMNFFSNGSKKEEDFCWQIEIKDRRVESKGFLVKTLWLESVDSFSFLHGVGLFFA